MKIDLDDLEAKARAATQGEWAEEALIDQSDGRSYRESSVIDTEGRVICDTLNAHSSWDEKEREAIGDYIAAAQPSTVLALIARIRELESRPGCCQ